MNWTEKFLQTFPQAHIQDDKRAHVEEVIKAMIKDGRSMLHVVADFDFTLSTYDNNGDPAPSTFAVIETDERVQLPDGTLVRDQANALRSKYILIEHDVHLPMEEKIPHMVYWWRKAQSLLLLSNLNKSMIRELVYNSKLQLRKGVQDFITDLLQSHTPILIFSAGLGDVIKIFLEKEIPEFDHNHQSSHIVSNFIQYDTEGNLVSFSDKLIHSFNKNEHEIHDTPYYRSILNRPNVILLGDSLGDVGMIGGMQNLKQTLKIGYLNRSTPTKLEVYQNIFDIVICDDSTFDIPNFILKTI
ncbi:unnamed protein product [Adineta ricciae]|uniref:5'-nucleotidase n=1 Tax=Adineta ricciae TaxID=249248 RepID=A0A814GWG2_ADIRI|nr:unnamed protein product [Adineta ricciae]CAF1001883.1 unnamed protein product [Adineta ricciae]